MVNWFGTIPQSLNIQYIIIERNDDNKMRDKIMSIDTEKRKELKINKSTLWYQQKKIKEGKSIKIYNKTRGGQGED